MAREEARHLKAIGLRSDDEFISKYSFCNVNREHDSVTIWVRDYIRDNLTLQDSFELMLLNLGVARLYNHPPSLSDAVEAGLFPLESKEGLIHLQDHMEDLQDEGIKILRGAYMVTPHGTNGKGKRTTEYITLLVEKLLEGVVGQSTHLSDFADQIVKCYGWSDFMANQLCTDFRYTKYYKDALDWETFVLGGPGTRRGLNRWNGAVTKAEFRKAMKQDKVQEQLLYIRKYLKNEYNVIPPEMHEHFKDINNLSNCFCEFDKWERCRAEALGIEGTKKARLRRYG